MTKDFLQRVLPWCLMVLGMGFRLWQLSNLPAILNRDEAALGYNALLLQQSGYDEWHRAWPLTLESFGDYKLIGYPALLVPLFGVLGANDWVVRLPSAVAGTLLIGLVYAFARQMQWRRRTALLAAGLTAVSPVFIFYSRMAFEANVALCFVMATLTLLLSLSRRWQWGKWVAAMICAVAAVCTYNTPFVLLPVILCWVMLLPWRTKAAYRWLVLASLAVVLVVGAWQLLPAASQKAGITIFTDETVWNQWTAFRAGLPSLWQPLIGHRFVYFIALMVRNFLASFSLSFLVTDGGAHPWHSLPGSGHLSVMGYVFGLIGFVVSVQTVWFARNRIRTEMKTVSFLFLLLASLLPAIITVDAPHATRSLLFFVVFTCLSARGIEWCIQRFFAQKTRLGWMLVAALIALEASGYVYRLFAQYPHQQAIFQPGFQTAISQVEQRFASQPVAVVDPTGYQYILTAWYLKMPASVFFSTVVRQLPDSIGFRYGQQVSHYHFIAQPADRAQTETVLVQWSPSTQHWDIEEKL